MLYIPFDKHPEDMWEEEDKKSVDIEYLYSDLKEYSKKTTPVKGKNEPDLNKYSKETASVERNDEND